jgi:hypothetical protein
MREEVILAVGQEIMDIMRENAADDISSSQVRQHTFDKTGDYRRLVCNLSALDDKFLSFIPAAINFQMASAVMHNH